MGGGNTGEITGMDPVHRPSHYDLIVCRNYFVDERGLFGEGLLILGLN